MIGEDKPSENYAAGQKRPNYLSSKLLLLEQLVVEPLVRQLDDLVSSVFSTGKISSVILLPSGRDVELSAGMGRGQFTQLSYYR